MPTHTTISSHKVPLLGKFAYGIGDMPLNLVWTGTAIFLLYFYTDVLNIAPATAGAIYLVALIWDGITDPVVATMADRTKTRWGKYRPYILFGAIPLALSYPLAYTQPGLITGDTPDGGAMTIAWALLTHCLLRTAFTVIGVPFSSLQARLTPDSQERAVLAGFRMVGAGIGGLLVSYGTPVIVQMSPDGESTGYLYAGAVASIIIFTALMFAFFCLREPQQKTNAGASTYDAKVDLGFLRELFDVLPLFLANKPLVRLLLVEIIGLLTLSMFGKCLLYFFKYELNRFDLVPYVTSCLGIAFIYVPFWIYLAGRTSKAFALSCGLFMAICGYLLFFFTPPTFIAGYFIATIIVGIGGWSLPSMFWSMLPDTVEYGEAVTGTRSEARIFGFATLAQKSAIGINAWLLGILLAAIGYVANEPQSESTLFSLRLVMLGIPVLGTVIMLWLLRGYKLNHEQHARIRQGLPS